MSELWFHGCVGEAIRIFYYFSLLLYENEQAWAKESDVIGINIIKTKMACSSGSTGRTKNCKCKESTIHIDHHKINLNLIWKAQQGNFLGLTGPLCTQMCRKWIALKIAPEMREAGSEWRLGEVSMVWNIRNTLSTCGLRLEAPHKDNMCRSIADNQTFVNSNISNKLGNLVFL